MEFWDANGEAETGTVVMSGHKRYLATPGVALGSTALASPVNIAVLEMWNLRTYPDLLNERLYFNEITR